MSFSKQIDTLRTYLQTDADYACFIEAQRAVLHRELKVPGIKQPDDTRDWWYTSEGRLGRAAVVYALTEDNAIGDWLRDAVLQLAREDADAWIGPFFRVRHQPLQGMLETRHLSAAAAQALLFAPNLFSDEEAEEIRFAIREKAAIPIEEWLKPYHKDPSIPHNNWVISELTGLFFAAAALDDLALVQKYLPLFNALHGDCNSDFYGEPAGYWSYACDSFLKIHFLLDWAFPQLHGEITEPSLLLNPFMWKYYRRQGQFLLQNFDQYRMRALTFGDDPTIDGLAEGILLYASVYHTESAVRGLAGARLEKLFLADLGKERPASCELICLLPFRGKEHVTENTFPPSRLFADGFLMYKDKWELPSVQIALQCGGTESPHVIEHRHADQLSFQIARDGIVILDDPSICCYRLNMYKQTRSAAWHSVPALITAEASPRLLEQEIMTAKNIREDRFCRRIYEDLQKDAFCVTGEVGELYPDEVLSMRRTFAAAGTHVLLIVDSFESSIPAAQIASFIGNNRRRMMKWNFGENCATLCREGVGVKIMAMQDTEVTLDYAALNDSNDVYPDSPLQGREGSGYIVRMQTKATGTSGKSIYVIIIDREEALEHWDAVTDGDTVTVRQQGTTYCRFECGTTISVLKGDQTISNG